MADFPQWTEIRRFNAEVQRRVSALPGVVSVAIAGAHPLEAGYTSSITVPGREAEAADWPEPSIRTVDSGYFRTMRVPMVAGREIRDDVAAAPVIAINETARRRFFEGRDPLGHQVNLWGRQRTVVAVVADERFHGLERAATPAIYLPASQAPIPNGSILVRVNGDPLAIAAALRAAVRGIDPTVPLHAIEPLTVTLSQTTAQRRFTMTLLGAFAAIALLLAMVGVHGVLSYTVAQRTREIGIRMALGADRKQVGELVLGQGMRLIGAGLVIGLLGALAMAQALSSLLFGVRAYDPVTLGAVVVGLGAVAMVASWLPARRAMGVEPIEALAGD
jgi:predicted permease